MKDTKKREPLIMSFTVVAAPGQAVWVMHKNIPVQTKVRQIYISCGVGFNPTDITYSLDFGTDIIPNKQSDLVFKTKEELIASL